MTVIPNNTLEASKAYVDAGLSVIPIKPNGLKQPATNMLPVISEAVEGSPRRGWAPFTVMRPTPGHLQRWFGGWGNSCGIAVVGGRVSGNLEAIDIDQTELIAPWLDRVRAEAPGLLDSLVLVQTPRPGLHCYYRCPALGRNEKLAQRPVTADDQNSPTVDLKVAIETRGEGGYALIPPSSGLCHPTGRPYAYVTERTLLDIQEITPAEREVLFAVSRTFDETPRSSRNVSRHTISAASEPRPLDRSKPGDDFSAQVSWDDLLERYGWSLWDVNDDGCQFWTRPGKGDGVSASVGFGGSDLLYVWSSNVPELEPETAYSKFSFITHMEYGGDFRRAARALRDQGYGRRQRCSGAGRYNSRNRGNRSMCQDLRQRYR
ncbi:MAG: bifunctional DNA primase/polymerase [Planctomycetaceae bacterium]